MEQITKEAFENYCQLNKQLQELAEPLQEAAIIRMTEYYNLFDKTKDKEYVYPKFIETIDGITPETICASGSDYCCGDTDYYHYEMPSVFLYDDSAFEQFKIDLKKRQANSLTFDEIADAKRAKEREAQERKILAELKDKYPDEA